MKISPLLFNYVIFIGNETILMGQYLHYFNNETEYLTALKNIYVEPWVSCIAEGNKVGYNIPKFVDLGLPSGTLWMSMNVGATGLYDEGSSFKWGELYPSTASDPYRWGSSSPYSKYNSTDKKVYLDLEDDVLAVNSGTSATPGYIYAIPTIEECRELYNSNYVTSDTDKTANITVFTSRVNGNSIIFPGREGVTVGKAQEPYFGVWTNERNQNYIAYANSFQTYEDSGFYYVGITTLVERTLLRNIRGVLRPYIPEK